MYRIESLQRGIGSSQFGKLFGGNVEHRLVQIILYQQAAHVPQGLFRNTGALVRIVTVAEVVMPFEVEGTLSDCLFVGQVECLLSKHETQHCVKFFRRSPVLFRVERGDLLHRKVGKDFLAENLHPGLLQRLPAYRTKMIQRVMLSVLWSFVRIMIAVCKLLKLLKIISRLAEESQTLSS